MRRHSRAATAAAAAGREALEVGRAPLARGPARRAARRARRRRLAAAAGAAAARDEPGGRRRRLLPLVHEPDHGPLEASRPGPGPAGRARRRLGAGGHAGLDPAGRRRHLLRRAVQLEGPPRRPRPDGRADRASRSGAGATAGALPVVSDASSCTLGLRAEAADALPEDLREKSRRARDPRLGRVARAAPAGAARAPQASAAMAVHPTCATRHLGLARRLEAVAGELADEVVVPVAATLLRLRGRPRDAPSGADRRRRPRTRPESWPSAGRSTPTSRPTGPARSASSARPASPTARSSSRSRS